MVVPLLADLTTDDGVALLYHWLTCPYLVGLRLAPPCGTASLKLLGSNVFVVCWGGRVDFWAFWPAFAAMVSFRMGFLMMVFMVAVGMPGAVPANGTGAADAMADDRPMVSDLAEAIVVGLSTMLDGLDGSLPDAHALDEAADLLESASIAENVAFSTLMDEALLVLGHHAYPLPVLQELQRHWTQIATMIAAKAAGSAGEPAVGKAPKKQLPRPRHKRGAPANEEGSTSGAASSRDPMGMTPARGAAPTSRTPSTSHRSRSPAGSYRPPAAKGPPPPRSVSVGSPGGPPPPTLVGPATAGMGLGIPPRPFRATEANVPCLARVHVPLVQIPGYAGALMAPLVWPHAAAADVRCLTSEELVWELASRIGMCGLTPMWAQSGALQDRLRALMDQAESRGIHPADVARRVVGMLRGRDAVPQQLPFAAEVAREMLRPYHLRMCVRGKMDGRLSPVQVWLKSPTTPDPGAAHTGMGLWIWHFFSWTNVLAMQTWVVCTTCGCNWSRADSWPFSFVGLSLLEHDSTTEWARFHRLASMQVVLLALWNQLWTGANMHMELGLRPLTVKRLRYPSGILGNVMSVDTRGLYTVLGCVGTSDSIPTPWDKD
ncbi:unnamed protein product [Symbiodinium natans]|uniref:Uncharacterized protein n=1 Tax=Symbiodinium natans TaxID=878477 RepID=A0A812SJ55_9DINO|nr:unnamed protein product [Symbiodinium natans]